MADKAQVKSLLVTLGTLAIRVRDQLAESYDQETYTNLLEELKQSINIVEQSRADLTEDLTQVEQGKVYATPLRLQTLGVVGGLLDETMTHIHRLSIEFF